MRRLLPTLLIAAAVLLALALPAGAQNPVPPTASTGSASAIGQTTAQLAGTVDPNGSATTYRFEYGTSDAYGLTTPETAAGDGTSSVDVTASLTGLTSGTTYHYRIVATNAAGVARGYDHTFKTLAAGRAPGISSRAAADVRQNSATLQGSLDPRGLAATFYFEWGTTTGYGQRTPDQSASGSGYRNVTAAISGLRPYTTYHYRLIASNSIGTTRSSDRSFRTLRAPTGVELSISGSPAAWGGNVSLSGRVLGSGVGGTTVAIERSDFPYTSPIWAPRTTNAGSDGSFRLDIGPIWQTTRLRAVTRTTFAASSPWVEVASRPRVGVRRAGSTGRAVVLTGAISPALPGARVSVQRQTLAGRWLPVRRGGVTRLGGNRSRYRISVPKIGRPSMVRVVVLPMDKGGHTLGYSRELRIRARG